MLRPCLLLPARRPVSAPSFFRSFSPRPPPPSPTRSVARPVLFAVAVSSASLLAAAAATNLDTDARLASLSRLAAVRSTTPLHDSRFADLVARARRGVAAFPRDWRLPTLAAEWWLNQTEAQRTALGIVAVNVVVFGVWQVPSLARRAGSWLVHDPLRPGRSVTMLTSVFSHRTPLHLLFNSLALYSFSSTLFASLAPPSAQRRSTTRYEFLAFYVSAGLFASLVSHVWSVRWLVARGRTVLPSLGASGALYAALGVTALAKPETSVSLIFLPWIPIPIGTAFFGMLALDLAGLVRGWQMFDHAAHLGGALAGLAYFTYGHAAFERCRTWLRPYTLPYSHPRRKGNAIKVWS